MDDAGRRARGPDDGRDDLDRLIDGALEQMGGGGPIDVRSSVLARLDGDAGAAAKRSAVWRPVVAVGVFALVAALAATMVSRQAERRAGSLAESRSETRVVPPVKPSQGLPSQSAALLPVEPPDPGMPLATRQGRPLPGTREIAGLGTASLAGRDAEPVEALQGAEPTLPGAPVRSPGEPIPAMPAPAPILIAPIVPAPIAVAPSVGNLGTPLGILPIADPAGVITIVERSGGTGP